MVVVEDEVDCLILRSQQQGHMISDFELTWKKLRWHGHGCEHLNIVYICCIPDFQLTISASFPSHLPVVRLATEIRQFRKPNLTVYNGRPGNGITKNEGQNEGILCILQESKLDWNLKWMGQGLGEWPFIGNFLTKLSYLLQTFRIYYIILQIITNH